jgi:membrane associated rhomboid family serine protease
MPARRFAALYAGIELALGIVGTSSGVAHFAHLGGMIGGFLLLRGWHVRAMPGEARERAG